MIYLSVGPSETTSCNACRRTRIRMIQVTLDPQRQPRVIRLCITCAVDLHLALRPYAEEA